MNTNTNKQNKNKQQNGINRQGLIDDLSKTFDEISTPIMKVLEPIGEIAGALGLNMLDYPTIAIRNEATRVQSQSNLNAVVGVSRAIPLVVDPKATSVTPIGAHKDERIGGFTDLMGIPVAVKGFGATSVINLWESTTLPGRVLFETPIGPLYELLNGDDVLHPLSAFGSMFDLWTGTLNVDVELYHTPFNKGALAVAFWNMQLGQTVTVDLSQMTHANLVQVNLQGNVTQIRLQIPFKHQLERLKTYDGSKFDECFTGSLVIYSLTGLQTKEGFPDKVPFVVRVSSNDMTFSNHSLLQAVEFVEDFPTQTDKMDFVRNDYPAPVVTKREQNNLKVVGGIRRQGDEGAVESTKDVYHEAGFGKAVEDVVKPVDRLRMTKYSKDCASMNAAQREWDIRKVFSQAHILNYVDIVIPHVAGPLQYFEFPSAAMIEQNMTPCVTSNFRFFTYDRIKVSLVLNTMNGVAGAGFMVYLRGVTNQADAAAVLTSSFQQTIDMNGGIVFSLGTDREIHMDCRNVYPLNNFSVDVPDNCGVLVVGLYTDTILGPGQTGSLNFVLKASIDGFEIREPNYNPNTVGLSRIKRQGDHEVVQESADNHQTGTVDNTTGTVQDSIHVNPYQEKVPALRMFRNNHTDAVMSFEQLKRYERVYNAEILAWDSQVFSIWDLITKHKFIYMLFRMVRFVHCGIRFKVRVIQDEPTVTRSSIALMAGFRGMYGKDGVVSSLTYQNDTLGSGTPAAKGGSSRAAIVEMATNTVGEQLDFEIPYTALTKVLTINGVSNLNNHFGYDFGDIFIASNIPIVSGRLVIYAALSDDATFSCPVSLIRGTTFSAYPNSIPAPPLFKKLEQTKQQQQPETDSDTDIEVISIKSSRSMRR
jgi:hypothetical protein